jgi:glycosyltransferase involved in cell wall biosynthesis
MPYRSESHSTNYGYPLKLHEYLASGRPVVGSRMRTLEDFTDVISIAGTTGGWSHALSAALKTDASSTAEVEKRRTIARKYNWDAIVHRIAGTFCKHLGDHYNDRFASYAAKLDI